MLQPQLRDYKSTGGQKRGHKISILEVLLERTDLLKLRKLHQYISLPYFEALKKLGCVLSVSGDENKTNNLFI